MASSTARALVRSRTISRPGRRVRARRAMMYSARMLAAVTVPRTSMRARSMLGSMCTRTLSRWCVAVRSIALTSLRGAAAMTQEFQRPGCKRSCRRLPPTSLSEPVSRPECTFLSVLGRGRKRGECGVQRRRKMGGRVNWRTTRSAHSLFLCFPVQRTVPCLTLCWLPSGSPATRPAPTFTSATASFPGSPPRMSCPGVSVLWTSTGGMPFLASGMSTST